MKFFNWMQSKFIGAQNTVPVSNHAKKESPKEEFSDWPHGLLAIGTFGNTADTIQVDQKNPHKNETRPLKEEEYSSPDLSEFTAEEVVKLQKELTKLLSKKSATKPTDEKSVANLPLDRFLNCPSSLEMDRINSNRFSTYSDNRDEEEEIDRTIRIILGRCKDVYDKKKKNSNKTIGIKSLSFLVKKMFVCRSGFGPTTSFRDTLQESRMEKLLRTMLTKTIYTQKCSRTSSTKKYIENYYTPEMKAEKEEEAEESHGINEEGSKWDKTDSEFIVLEI
ncbi:hypothetical protein ABFS83_09G118800 [Erythranthe nasuta]